MESRQNNACVFVIEGKVFIVQVFVKRLLKARKDQGGRQKLIKLVTIDRMQEAVKKINADPSLSIEEKSRRIQAIFRERAEAAQALVSESRKVEGPCEHYVRNCDIETPCCGKFYGCRLCHDDEQNGSHTLDRRTTTRMKCRRCHTVQPIARACQIPTCTWKTTKYYCENCRLWEDRPDKNIFHCVSCGICRIGRREDTWHCDNCALCLPLSMSKEDHKCIKDASMDSCVCGEYMHTSTRSVILLPCGHTLHTDCRDAMIKSFNFACPKCRKSILRSASYERHLQADINMNPMPEEYHRRCRIACNDCEEKTVVSFHFLGNRCRKCGSFNTGILQTLSPGEDSGESSEDDDYVHVGDDDDDEAHDADAESDDEDA